MFFDRNTSRSLTRWIVVVVVAAMVAPAFAKPAERGFDRRNVKRDQFLLTTTNIDQVAARYGLTVVAKRGGPDNNTYLVRAPRGVDLGTVMDSEVSAVENIALASLPELDLAAIDITAEASEDIERSGTYSTPCIDTFLGATWSGYVDQRAIRKIQVHGAQYLMGWYCGQGVVVAVIDTAIDPTHPKLANALVPGYDFLAETESEEEALAIADLDTRIRTIVESSATSTLNGSADMVVLDSAAVLLGDVETSVIGDLQEYPSHYGHGDMVAGVVRAVAPGAKIMPLRVFDDEGNGHALDIIDAIYYAVDNGAHIINMSFSMSAPSAEVEAAIEYARRHGVSTVGAAGNQGEHTVVYPAGYASTIGVASTGFNDHLTQFTNYGLVTADLAAPGNSMITLFPGGAYAAGWGTSFSAPLTAGVLALIRPFHAGFNRSTHKHMRLNLLLGSWYYEHLWDDILASSRLDAVGALIKAAN